MSIYVDKMKKKIDSKNLKNFCNITRLVKSSDEYIGGSKKIRAQQQMAF